MVDEDGLDVMDAAEASESVHERSGPGEGISGKSAPFLPPHLRTRRAAALRECLETQAELQQDAVILPMTGRQYTIHIPTDASRDRMFEEAQKDPDKTMPFWSRIWPSGVGLADAVLRRSDQVAGLRVLELGCGLGTTATAALEAGARLVVADYSTLPIAFCRYNALYNTGRAPSSIQFNWRHPSSHAMARAESGGGFPLILAADLLYESRDIEPLLAIVERLLAPDGMLWLAEPGRRTAQRFLNTAAELGWQGVSEEFRGPWPDASDTTVHIHFLRRPTHADYLATSLGGWRA